MERVRDAPAHLGIASQVCLVDAWDAGQHRATRLR